MLAAFAFVAIFLLIASGGLLLFYRDAVLQRLSAVVSPSRGKQGGLRSSLQHTGEQIGDAMGNLERVLPKSKAEVSVTEARLIRAGIRKESAVKIFYSAKVGVPVALALVLLISGAGRLGGFAAYAVVLVMGFMGPDFWLGRRIKSRQAAIRRGLPDALDLLVICVEAGQSMDGATARTAEELRHAQPAVSDELGMVVLEQRGGRTRADAWKRFGERTEVDTVRNLVAILIQSEQFGTSVAKTLRVHSDTLRTQRRQKVEEQAAKTSVKLVFPLVFFIFPALFIVVLGPLAMVMADAFTKYFSH